MIDGDINQDGMEPTAKQDTLPRYIVGDAPDIYRLRKRFDEAREDPNGYRLKSQKYRDYFDGPKQLSSEVRTVLQQRNQPAIYTNRIRPAINGILGVLLASQTDPRAYPRNPDDEKQAEVCSKTLRYIADESLFQQTKIDCAENFLIEGTCAVMIEVEEGVSRMAIAATQIRWEEFYYDPYSRRADLKDARYMGVAKWQDAAQVKENPRWRDRINEIGDPLSAQGFGLGSTYDDTWQDRPINMGWIDRTRRRIMLVEEYAIVAGTWMRCVYIATGVLEYGPSPYLDEKRRPCNPIEAVSCYVDRENGRYSPIADMIPIQDEVNASRSRSLHLMNSRQVQQVDLNAPPVDSETVRLEAAKADGVVPMGWQIVSTAQQTNDNLLRMQEAKNELERMGPTPAVLGRGGGDAESGRARLVLQQAGLTELARPLGRLSDWELRCYRQFWNRAKQYWTDPMWIRVTDELQAPEFLKVNEPKMGMVMQPVTDPATGQPVIDPATGQPAVMPGIGIVGYENRLAELDMDIIIDSTPDTVNLQAEVFADFKELVASGIDPFSPQFELLIEMSPLENKAQVLERLKGKRDEIQQAQAQANAQAQQEQEEAKQIAKAGALADIENTQADTAVKASTAVKNQADAAETEAKTFFKPIELANQHAGSAA